MRHRFFCCAVLAVLLTGRVAADEPGAAAREPLRVLILDQDTPTRPGSQRFMQGFRGGMREAAPAHHELFSESLELRRLDKFKHEENVIDWLASKYDGTRFDSIVAASDTCLQIALGLRQRIAPESTIIFVAITPDRAAPYLAEPRLTGVVHEFPVGEILDMALRLFPQTQRVVHIGHSDGVRNIGPFIPRQLSAAANAKGLELVDLCDLSLADLKARLAALSADTVVF